VTNSHFSHRLHCRLALNNIRSCLEPTAGGFLDKPKGSPLFCQFVSSVVFIVSGVRTCSAVARRRALSGMKLVCICMHC